MKMPQYRVFWTENHSDLIVAGSEEDAAMIAGEDCNADTRRAITIDSVELVGPDEPDDMDVAHAEQEK
jgi:hypothetical protein